MVETDDRHINTPSWSLSIKMINDVSIVAEEENRSQSSIIKEALEDWFALRAINKDEDEVICGK